MNFEPEKILETEPFRSFLAAWKASQKDANQPPRREDISLKKFSKHLANMAVMERMDNGSLRFRLVGSEITERTALSKDKHSMIDLLPDDFAGENIRTWAAVLDLRVGAVGQFSVHYPNGSCRGCTSILLPMRAKDGSPLVIALNQSGAIYSSREPRDVMQVGADYAYSQLFDAGFGLPDDADDYAVARNSTKD